LDVDIAFGSHHSNHYALFKNKNSGPDAGGSCLLATQEAEIRRMVVQSQSGQIVCKALSRKNPSQKRAGGGLKVKALSSSPSTV
jgi:hypothetical protein